MATTFFLVRHAEHDLLNRVLTGRMHGVSLSAQGRAQAEGLARWFKATALDAIDTSPTQRARETAEFIARLAGLPCDLVAALDEIDMGAWTGCTFEDLGPDPLWQGWNRSRDRARAPGGETMAEAGRRVMTHLRARSQAAPEGRIVLVSHADVIKAVILGILDAPLQSYDRLEIAPASVSTLLLDAEGGRLQGLNFIPRGSP